MDGAPRGSDVPEPLPRKLWKIDWQATRSPAPPSAGQKVRPPTAPWRSRLWS